MEEMNRHEIEQMLEDERIGRLCMASPQGVPYVIPLPFCFVNGALYLRVSSTGRKGSVLAANNRVCFEVDCFTDTLDDYASVLVEGRLVPVEDLHEKARVRDENSAKYMRLRNGHRPGHGRGTPLGQLVMQKIVVERISGRRKERTAQLQEVMR
jgi:uncharacterized protein